MQCFGKSIAESATRSALKPSCSHTVIKVEGPGLILRGFNCCHLTAKLQMGTLNLMGYHVMQRYGKLTLETNLVVGETVFVHTSLFVLPVQETDGKFAMDTRTSGRGFCDFPRVDDLILD